MTTDPHDEHGEILRRALHAEADSVNPAGDGLERIRARIADGSGRRFGLGRFGLGGFGFDRFTVGWARPVLAVAAAVAIAGFGVTAAPQTIDLIQQSVGSNGPSGGGDDHAAGNHTSSQGTPESPDPSTPGGTASDSPNASQTPSSSSSPGLSSCSIQPPETPTAAASPGSAPDDADKPAPCPSDSPSKRPTTTPTPPTSSPPDPDEPSQAPTSPPASESTQSGDQGTGAASTP